MEPMVGIHKLTLSSNQQLLTIITKIGEASHSIGWLPDTGAEVDAISLRDLSQLGEVAKSHLFPTTQDVIAANGQSLGPVGSVHATLCYNGKFYSTTLRVFRHLTTPLLSKQGCVKLGLINPEWPLPIQAISAGRRVPQPPTTACLSSEAIKKSIMQDFPKAFDDSILRPMQGKPMKIELVPGAIPCKKYKAHTVPFHWRSQVKEQIDSMVSKKIIEAVPVGEAIDWCHPMVVVAKKNSAETRITVDLTSLNKFVRRPAYPVKIPKEVVSRIPPGNRYFTTLDARHGYWQVPLDEESKKLTTFITPWGSFRYCRNVMGLISAGDEALLGLANVEKIVEDTIIFDKDLTTHEKRVREVIQRFQDHGVTLNAKKFVFAQSEVDYCGFRITRTGYSSAPHLVSALSKFPVPVSKTDVRSFCGLIQQFEAFSHEITELAGPLRSLLSLKSAFIWETVHQKSFEAVIKELISPRILTHFHPNLPVRLETDAAQSKGLGYALWQQQPNDEWRLLQAGSRFVTPTESRYSATEVELLAVIWAVRKCRLFLLGQPFQLIVDHRPLIPIINSKTLDEIDNPRLLRLKEKLLFSLACSLESWSQAHSGRCLLKIPSFGSGSR